MDSVFLAVAQKKAASIGDGFYHIAPN
jgi:hypothetical protein